MESHGPTLTEILAKAWDSPFATKSNFAREAADGIAVLSYMRLLTTKQTDGVYGNTWRVTPEGLRFLWAQKGLIR